MHEEGQGEKEEELGLPVSPFMDRKKTDIGQCQAGFISILIKPFFDEWTQFLGDANRSIFNNVEANIKKWKDEGESALGPRAEKIKSAKAKKEGGGMESGAHEKFIFAADSDGERMRWLHAIRENVKASEAKASKSSVTPAMPIKPASLSTNEKSRAKARLSGLTAEGQDYLILPSLYSTCLRATGSYFLMTIFSVMVRAFFLVT